MQHFFEAHCYEFQTYVTLDWHIYCKSNYDEWNVGFVDFVLLVQSKIDIDF